MIVVCRTPPNPPRRIEFKSNSITIGRMRRQGKKVDLDLSPDPTISSLHARLSFENGEYWIEDLGSTNGTCVDGVVISGKMRLVPGAQIQIGRAVIQIERTAAPPRQKEKAKAELVRESPGIDFDTPIAAEKPAGPGDESELSQLRAFYLLSQKLGAAGSLDSMEEILIQQLQQAIPSAQRGAVLLPDERGELLLKIHWPTGAHSVSMTLAQEAFAEREPISWQVPKGQSTLSAMPSSVVYYEVEAALYVPLISGTQVVGVMYVDNADDRDAFSTADLDLMTTIAAQVARFIRENHLQPDMQREEIIRANLLRQFSPRVADHILDGSNRLQLGGNRVDPITVLVSDIRGFTSLSAKMEPADVVRMLNEMFDAFVPIIFEYDGVVDKYVGDSVLAVFGSPDVDEQQWEKAVRAALEMQRVIGKLGEAWKARRLPVFQVGIGIHSGAAIQGFIGSAQRTEYTVIGDTVNRAARFCDGAGSGEIFISSSVFEHVYRLVEVGAKTVKTKHPEREPDMKGYLVKGLRTAQARSRKTKT
jgi:adenylate cyclase